MSLSNARIMPYRPKPHTPGHAFESIDACDSTLSELAESYTNQSQKKSKIPAICDNYVGVTMREESLALHADTKFFC